MLWVELFVLANLAFLSLDIFLAHSENSFRHPAEWLPFYFSLGAPIVLGVAIAGRETLARPRLWSVCGGSVGFLSIFMGLAGVLYHLESRFFYERTILSLTYTAPFVAPLSYAGLGLLLVLNRMVPDSSREWSEWLLLLTLGGFFGNFVLSVTDHAANGFFHLTEWIPVGGSAFAVGFLLVPLIRRADAKYLKACILVMLLQGAVGIAGFFLHGVADLHGPSKSLFENVISGAPPMAPLLFPNLAVLSLIALHTFGNALSAAPSPTPSSP